MRTVLSNRYHLDRLELAFQTTKLRRCLIVTTNHECCGPEKNNRDAGRDCIIGRFMVLHARQRRSPRRHPLSFLRELGTRLTLVLKRRNVCCRDLIRTRRASGHDNCCGNRQRHSQFHEDLPRATRKSLCVLFPESSRGFSAERQLLLERRGVMQSGFTATGALICGSGS